MAQQDRGARPRGDRQGGFGNSPFKGELRGFKVGALCLHCGRPIPRPTFGQGYLHPECEKASGPSAWTPGPGNWPKRVGRRQDWDPLCVEAVPGTDDLAVVRASTLLAADVDPTA